MARNSVGIDRLVYLPKGGRVRHPVPIDSPWIAAIPEVCVMCWTQEAKDWQYIDAGVRRHVVHNDCRALAESRLVEAKH